MNLHIYKNDELLYNAVAHWITELIKQTLEVKESFVLCLSGGETPKKLYQILVSESVSEKINWSRIHIFWGDERVVPFDDERNNAKMAYDTLLSKIDIPANQIHIMRTDIIADKSAIEYETILHQYFDNKQTTFDLTLLGLGDDGHTLSLFPENEILDDKNSWVSAVHSKEKGERITLMPSVVNKSSAIAFLVTGQKKAKVVQQILEEPQQHNHPALLIQPSNTELHWFIDEEAAKYLKK